MLLVLLLAYWEWLCPKQLKELDSIQIKPKGQIFTLPGQQVGTSSTGVQHCCSQREGPGGLVPGWQEPSCVCGTLSILFHGLQCESSFSTFLEYIIGDINNNNHFMVNSWNSWNLRCFSFARHMLRAYFRPPHGCICLRSQMLNQFPCMAIGRGNNILTPCQPMQSGSSRMRELPACVFTFSWKKNECHASKWDSALF